MTVAGWEGHLIPVLSSAGALPATLASPGKWRWAFLFSVFGFNERLPGRKPRNQWRGVNKPDPRP